VKLDVQVRGARKDNKLKGLTNYIQAAGFSDPTPPERQSVIGRSELLRKPRSKKSTYSGVAAKVWLRWRMG
jgi:hypothetical protein